MLLLARRLVEFGTEALTDFKMLPRIGGQHKEYVVEQLKAYQSGVRKNAMMEDVAKRLSAEEMNAVGNFIQGLH